jgi:hypothetical protein
MKYLTLILIALLFISCSDLKNQNLRHQLQDSKSEEALWADAYIEDYLEHNKDRLTKVDGYPVTYLKGVTERYQRIYAEVTIGHSFEHRYITDQTIYIDSLTREIYEYDVVNDSLIIWKPTSDNNQMADTIPPNGTYRFDVAFAEWEGKSMGEKVTVVINGDSIIITYEGDGSLTNAKKGDVFDQGKIMKHKTGVWIIGKSKSDAQAEEIGGCSGGPTVIDFKARKYWMC